MSLAQAVWMHSFFPWLARAALVVSAAFALGACSDAATSEATAQTGAAAQRAGFVDAAARFDDVQDDMEATDARLARQLGQLHGALSGDQQQQYVEQFDLLPRPTDVRTRYLAAAKSLKDELWWNVKIDGMSQARARESIGPCMMLGSECVGAELYSAYTRLARTPYALDALEFAVRVLAKDSLINDLEISKSAKDVYNDLIAPALPGSLVHLLIETRDDGAALSELRKTLADAKGDVSTALDILDSVRGARSLGPLADAEKLSNRNLGLAVKAAGGVLAIWGAGDSDPGTAGDYRAAMESVQSIADGISGLADATTAFRRIVRGKPPAELLDRLGAVAGRISGGLDAALGTIRLIGDLQNAGSGSGKARVVGDAIDIAGGMAVLLGASGAGTALAVVAIGVGMFAEIQAQEEIADQDRREKLAVLGTIVSADVANGLANAREDLIAELVILTLRPEEIQWLAGLNVQLLAPGMGTYDYLWIERVEDLLNFSHAATINMMEAIIAGYSDAEQGTVLASVVRTLSNTSSLSYAQNRADTLSAIRDAAKDDSPRWANAYTNLATYLDR